MPQFIRRRTVIAGAASLSLVARSEASGTPATGATSLGGAFADGQVMPHGAVIQRSAGLDYRRAFTISFRHAGAPVVRAQIRKYGVPLTIGGAQWQTVGNLTLDAAAGTASGTLANVPVGDGYQLVLQDPVSGATHTDTNYWGVGINILFMGQSNMGTLIGEYGRAGGGNGGRYDTDWTSQARDWEARAHARSGLQPVRFFGNSGWWRLSDFVAFANGGKYPGWDTATAIAGQTRNLMYIGRQLQAALGADVPVGLCVLYRGATTAANWYASPAGGQYTSIFAPSGTGASVGNGGADPGNKLPIAGGSVYLIPVTAQPAGINSPLWYGGCEMLYWCQGEYDALAPITPAKYAAYLDTLYAGTFSEAMGDMPPAIGIVGLGPQAQANGARYVEIIRSADLAWPGSKPGTWVASTIIDNLALYGDMGVHGVPYYPKLGGGTPSTSPGSYRCARRLCQDILHRLGKATNGGKGPTVSGAARHGSVITVTVQHDGGTALVDSTGANPGGQITGWYVSSDNFATGSGPGTGNYITPTSVVISGPNRISITLPAVPAGTVWVKHCGGTPGNNTPYDAAGNIASQCPDTSNMVHDNVVLPYDAIFRTKDIVGCPLQPTAGAIAVA